MIERYDFTDLIRRHSVNFEVLTHTQGKYINGKYQKGTETVTQCRGAILPLQNGNTHRAGGMADGIIYQSGGTYTAKDRALYMISPLEGALKEIQVRYKGDVYSVESVQDFSDYSPTYIYVLKWVEPVSGGDAE